MTRQIMIIIILHALWTSADFESDFESDWSAVTKIFRAGDFDKIPDEILKCCIKWKHDWDLNQ